MDRIVYDAGLVGTWTQDEKPTEGLIFTRRSENSYWFTPVGKDDVRLTTFLVDLRQDGWHILDIDFSDMPAAYRDNSIVEGHPVLVIRRTDNELTVKALDTDYVIDNRGRVPAKVRVVGDVVFLDGDASKLQQYLISILDVSEAWNEQGGLVRQE